VIPTASLPRPPGSVPTGCNAGSASPDETSIRRACRGTISNHLPEIVDVVCSGVGKARQYSETDHPCGLPPDERMQVAPCAAGGITDDLTARVDRPAALPSSPASVPRSCIPPALLQRKAWVFVPPPAKVEWPAIKPQTLIPNAPLLLPPGSVPKSCKGVLGVHKKA